MKLVRYGALGAEKPGIIDANGVLRDLSDHVPDIAGETLSDPALQALRALYHRLYDLTVAQSRFVIDDIRLGSFSKKFHALWHLSRISS